MDPPTKRRRFQESRVTLSKPFRSPLRKSAENKLEAPPTSSGKSNFTQKSKDTTGANDVVESSSQLRPPCERQNTLGVNRFTQSPSSNREQVQRLSVNANGVSELQRAHSSLLRQLSKLRQDLDTVQQAEKIESAGQDAELESLISKWKMASRELAEEVFRTAKDRVNRMGGVGAWRERSQRPGGWEEDDNVLIANLTDEQREAIEIAKEDSSREASKYGAGSSLQQEPGKENEVRDSFHDISETSYSQLSPVFHHGYDAQKSQR